MKFSVLMVPNDMVDGCKRTTLANVEEVKNFCEEFELGTKWEGFIICPYLERRPSLYFFARSPLEYYTEEKSGDKLAGPVSLDVALRMWEEVEAV